MNHDSITKLYEIVTIDGLKQVAEYIASKIQNGTRVIYLTGNLGAGKTTLAKYVLAEFDIDFNSVKSPTYTLKRTFKVNKVNFNHIDLYRLTSDSLEELEVYPDDEEVYIIEWADKISTTSHLKPDMVINITYRDTTRKITVESL